MVGPRRTRSIDRQPGSAASCARRLLPMGKDKPWRSPPQKAASRQTDKACSEQSVMSRVRRLRDVLPSRPVRLHVSSRLANGQGLPHWRIGSAGASSSSVHLRSFSTLLPITTRASTFPTLGAAIAHAERQGLPFLVEDRSHPEAGRTDRRTARTALQQSFQEVLSTYLLFAWWDAQYGRGAMPDALELACTEGSGSLPAGQAGG
jgi:hypothetical protein